MSRSDELPRNNRPTAAGGRLKSRSGVTSDVPVNSYFERMMLRSVQKGLVSETDLSNPSALEENFISGLLDAVSTTLHVLSFYQGRHVEEGFISTAREERSIFEIAKLLGISRRPALSAEAFCSLTAVDIPGDGQPMDVPELIASPSASSDR